jgi:LuxR family transcriptional regulator, quorum-sensing system regulator BjaR1
MTMVQFDRAGYGREDVSTSARAATMDVVRDALTAEYGRSREQVLDAMERLLEDSGFRSWLVVSVPLPAGDVRQHILRARWPESFMQKYLREDLARIDPLYRAAVSARSPVRDSDLRESASVTGERAAVLDEYSAHGLGDTVAMPCVRVGAYQLAALLSGPRKIGDTELSLIAIALQHIAERLFEAAPEALHRPSQLTARERQIVALTAEGFTSNEIAAMLTISARTVFAHLTSAGDKLKAANKTETVVNAFRYGQIAL